MANTEFLFVAIVCHAGAVLFLLFAVVSKDGVQEYKFIPNCIYPFNTSTTGGVVVFI